MLRCATYSVKMMFGIRSKEISFDFNHEQLYISAGLGNRKIRNGILIMKLSTAELACYAEAICYILQTVASIHIYVKNG